MTLPDDPPRSAQIPWRAVQWATIGIACVGLVFRLRTLGDGDWTTVSTSAAYQFTPVVAVLVASVGLRLRSTVQVLAAALGGFFSCTWVAYHLGTWTTNTLGEDNAWRLTLAIPVIEEVAKALLVLFIAWTWRRKSMSPGILDLALAGMAVGAGFAFHEDLLWGRVSAGGFDGALGWVLPSVHMDTGLVAGHLVWTGIMGLAIGTAVTRRWRWSWAAVVGAAALVVFDHGSWNSEPLRDGWGWVVGWGWLPIATLVGGLLFAFVADTTSVRHVPSSQRILPWDVVRYARHGKLATPLRRWYFGTEIMRVTTGTAHARAREARQAGPLRPPGDGALRPGAGPP